MWDDDWRDDEDEWAYAEAREREEEEREEERQRARQAEFDVGLDAYQARIAEEVEEAADRSYETAARPSAVREDVAFQDLRVGDYMTNEPPGGRWVKIVEIKPSYRDAALLAITFEIPEPVTVNLETRWVIDRKPDDTVTIDASARPEPVAASAPRRQPAGEDRKGRS